MQPGRDTPGHEGLDHAVRATITRIGARKLDDDMGREIMKEGELMGQYVFGKVLGSGYFGSVHSE